MIITESVGSMSLQIDLEVMNERLNNGWNYLGIREYDGHTYMLFSKEKVDIPPNCEYL